MILHSLSSCVHVVGWDTINSADCIVPWQHSGNSNVGGTPGGMALVLVLDGDVASAARQIISLVRHAREELLLGM